MRLLLERQGHIATTSTTRLPFENRIRKGIRTGFCAGVVDLALCQLTKKLVDDRRQAVCNRLADYRVTIDQDESERGRQRNAGLRYCE